MINGRKQARRNTYKCIVFHCNILIFAENVFMKSLLFITLFTLTATFCHSQRNEKATNYPTYKFNIEGGYNIAIRKDDTGRFDFSTSHGITFNDLFFIGAGIGLHNYSKINGPHFPTFLEVRSDLLKVQGIAVPFIGIKAGCTFNGADSFDYIGTYLAPYVGVHFLALEEHSLYLSVGYTNQEFSYDYYNAIHNLGGITIKVGFDF